LKRASFVLRLNKYFLIIKGNVEEGPACPGLQKNLPLSVYFVKKIVLRPLFDFEPPVLSRVGSGNRSFG
jgi:hypothetical protein